jgi:alpha-amylase
MAVGFMLARPYGFTRVMSSYRWQRNIQNGQVSFQLLKVSFSQEIKIPCF